MQLEFVLSQRSCDTVEINYPDESNKLSLEKSYES